jgi:hypothetical protein
VDLLAQFGGIAYRRDGIQEGRFEAGVWGVSSRVGRARHCRCRAGAGKARGRASLLNFSWAHLFLRAPICRQRSHLSTADLAMGASKTWALQLVASVYRIEQPVLRSRASQSCRPSARDLSLHRGCAFCFPPLCFFAKKHMGLYVPRKRHKSSQKAQIVRILAKKAQTIPFLDRKGTFWPAGAKILRFSRPSIEAGCQPQFSRLTHASV